MEHQITLPSKPRVVHEEGTQGVYEIDSLYPGYGHTLGNSLRRIILSSLPGAAVTSVKIEDVQHEFATIDGVRESVMEILLNLKRVHFTLHGDEAQTIRLSVKGPKTITAGDFQLPTQVEIANPDQHVCDIAGKASFELEATIERGLGYIPPRSPYEGKGRHRHHRPRRDLQPLSAALIMKWRTCASATARTSNRLRILIETNGTIAPREGARALHRDHDPTSSRPSWASRKAARKRLRARPAASDDSGKDASKVKVDDLGLPARIASALTDAGIKSAAGLARKTASALKELDGIGDKAVEEIENALGSIGLGLKGE